jgi:ABC-type uncharacterized transport system substrate-binding protein
MEISPGITGLPSVQMFAKRLELLKEAVPSLSRVAVLTSTEKNFIGGQMGALMAAAKQQGFNLMKLVFKT